MAYAYYARPDDDAALDAVLVSSVDADPNYPASNLTTWNPAKPAKLTEVEGDWVVTLQSPQTIRAVAIPYHYLDAGLDVRIQANSSNDWSSPPFEVALTIPEKRIDGPSYQRWTQTPYLLFDEAQTYLYWRLYIAGDNSQAVTVGRFMLLKELREITLYFGGGDIEEGDGPPDGLIETTTELGVELPIVIGGPRRSLSAVLTASDTYSELMGVAEASEFKSLHQSLYGYAHQVHPYLLIPRAELNDAWLVRPSAATSQRSHKEGNWEMWPFTVREVSRGLPWP